MSVSDKCPRCGAARRRVWEDPLTHAVDHVYECGSRHVIYEDGLSKLLERKDCLLRQVEALRKELQDAEEALDNLRQQYEALQAAAEDALGNLRQQYEALRAAAEDALGNLRQQYEALRAAVVAAADEIGKSAERAWKACDLSTRSLGMAQGMAHGLEQAENIVRAALEQHKPEVVGDAPAD